MSYLESAPAELADAIREFFPGDQTENAAQVAFLESGWNAFAVNDTTGPSAACGEIIGSVGGVAISAERSVGYFQINSCSFPTWEWQRLYNARHNVGTAHLIWANQGWSAWYFSAKTLGLL